MHRSNMTLQVRSTCSLADLPDAVLRLVFEHLHGNELAAAACASRANNACAATIFEARLADAGELWAAPAMAWRLAGFRLVYYLDASASYTDATPFAAPRAGQSAAFDLPVMTH
jgi:hypothetical protein